MTKKDVIEICSTHNEVKSVVAERIIRILKNKIYKYMILISKNVYIDKLDETVNKYNNKYHIIIKIKFVPVNSRTNIDFNKENNKEDPKFKVGDNVRISKYKNMFAEDYTPNQFEEIFVIKKVKKTIQWTCYQGF